MILAAAAPADVAGFAALHAQGFDRPWTAQELVATAASPGVATLFAQQMQGGAPTAAGFVMLRVVLDEAEILTLVVATQARRRGIGAALLESAVAAAEIAGAAAAWLEVAEDNAAAVALYDAAGFRPAGRRRGYYARETGVADALVLRRALNTAAV